MSVYSSYVVDISPLSTMFLTDSACFGRKNFGRESLNNNNDNNNNKLINLIKLNDEIKRIIEEILEEN